MRILFVNNPIEISFEIYFLLNINLNDQLFIAYVDQLLFVLFTSFVYTSADGMRRPFTSVLLQLNKEDVIADQGCCFASEDKI